MVSPQASLPMFDETFRLFSHILFVQSKQCVETFLFLIYLLVPARVKHFELNFNAINPSGTFTDCVSGSETITNSHRWKEKTWFWKNKQKEAENGRKK